MSEHLVYVYAIASVFEPDDLKDLPSGVDGQKEFGVTGNGELTALYSSVDADAFSQETIDERSTDLEWLGALGYQHQAVIAHLAQRTTIVPLRAFTLFSQAEGLVDYLDDHEDDLIELLEVLEGKEEWTLRVELDPVRWNDALVKRVAALAALETSASGASSGKSFLIRKQLEDKKKDAARDAENHLLDELRASVEAALEVDVLVENRQKKSGSFPQINMLVRKEQAGELARLQTEMNAKYVTEGVTLALTGPWPPYSFVAQADDRV